MSLEASTTPESLVIVWPVQCDPRTTGITAYSVLINGQPFGEQVSMRNNCCFLLSWDKIKRGSHFLCHARCLAHFRVRTMILRISFSFKTVCYVKSHVHCYLTTGLYISHVLVCHKTTLKPPRSPLLQNNVISHTNQNLEQTTSSENSIIVFSQVRIFIRKFLNPGVLFLL